MSEIQKFIVSRDDSIYEAWPDITLTPSGKLICTFTECAHHGNRESSRIMITESLDRGRTWSQKKAFSEMSNAASYFNNSRVSVLADGRIAVICDKVEGTKEYRSEIWVWLSEDDGNTWSGPTVYPFCGIVPDKLKQLRSGRIIIAAHHTSPETGKLEEYMWYSDDNGKTWSDRVTIAAHPNYNLCEVSIIQCENNTLATNLLGNASHAVKQNAMPAMHTIEGAYRSRCTTNQRGIYICNNFH